MKILLKSTNEVHDCSHDVAASMVAARLADWLTDKEVNDLNMRAKPSHFLNWFARDGEIVDGGYQYAPVLIWRCETCQSLCYSHPEKEPASQTTFHGEKQHCDDDVYQRYLSFFDAWSKKGNARLKGTYSRVLQQAIQRTKDKLDDWQPNSNPAKSGAAVAI